MKILIAMFLMVFVVTANIAKADEADDFAAALNNKDPVLIQQIGVPLADSGNLLAQYALGLVYFSGRFGVKVDMDKAVMYMQSYLKNPSREEKTDQGREFYATALSEMAIGYMGGYGGLKQNTQVAAALMWRAAHYGNENAQYEMNKSLCGESDAACSAKLTEKITRCQDVCWKE